ncbi:hypothetical protein K469DRAFT_730017 [Zopfia rhizophila CBS 207.26]|uniref:Ataxin-10 homolog n=1 Tax=Zopfia rhizophila CBS 207.26 TaxID=1314779 RepID=A0A6A6EN69_9PEZI|nr:hypothetical protein K469DRAFT_730017 [Zopfia rhizophila CBS 207.26]
MDESGPEERPQAKPFLTRLRLALGSYTVHFNNSGYVKDETMRMLDVNVCKKTLEETRRNLEVREELGTSYQFWDDLSSVLIAAIPSLDKRSFAAPDPAAPEYEGQSGPLIASYSSSLLKDLERLNQVIAIARNVLTFGEKAQSLSADRMFDKQVFDLINVCVRVTARGYDGEAGTQDEDKWQSVINAYKKLLITCLQFLNNLVARNEQRKLMLWIQLFDNHLDNDLPNFADMKYKMDIFPTLDRKAKGEAPQGELKDAQSLETLKVPRTPASSPFLFYIGKIGPEVKRSLLEQGEKAGATEIAAECKRRWQSMSEEDRNKWNMLYAEVVAKFRHELRDDGELSTTYKNIVDQHAKNEESVQALAHSINQLQVEVDKMRSSVTGATSTSQAQPAEAEKDDKWPTRLAMDETILDAPLKDCEPHPAEDSDFRVTYRAKVGAEILQQGKDDLMKRLETFSDRPAAGGSGDVASPPPHLSPTSPNGGNNVPPVPGAASDEEESEDDYDAIPGDDGRGLLTDVPLILGPTEIEVLPMIIMAGIVEPAEGQPGHNPDPEVLCNIRNMTSVRCHLLLAQDNGRNLLRELLIFVAAWDLREEELYFKFMVKIMEAILSHGLLPFAYHAFRESKDIISPAQAVIMKLLTNIFRARQSRNAPKHTLKSDSFQVSRSDAHMVNFLLTEFRRHIIPQTCALIFLQGQIRAGHAHPEDFPLNLWDMERMYEGVYQYLEFFAILTENEIWKNMLANWEVTCELVTLLKELDAAIPKGGMVQPLASNRNNGQPSGAEAPASNGAPPVAVERPYDTNNGPAPEGYMPSPRPYIDEAQDEPSDFEWRNLKKLAVLVLSSLVWKNRKVQDQVRPLGGIEAILNCCTHDEHNPYIREHAIMCLRFLMEGNKENQDVVRELEPKGTVPNEVLDQHGYETYIDSKGQVLLRRREGVRAQSAAGASNAKGKSKLGEALAQTRDPKDLEQLVQQVMRELPARVQGVRHDAEKAAALAKLDKGFDGKG